MGSCELDDDDNDLMVILRRCAELFWTVKGGVKESAVCVCVCLCARAYSVRTAYNPSAGSFAFRGSYGSDLNGISTDLCLAPRERSKKNEEEEEEHPLGFAP